MGAVAIGALLLAVLLFIAAAMVWQEVRSSSRDAQPVYLLDEAARFVFDRLPAGTEDRLGLDDVKSILEWGLYHSQVVTSRETEGPAVLGGEAAVQFVTARAGAGGGEPYHREDVASVLDLETEYLAAIGAVGMPVEEDAS
jgi:hypothetical protein